MAAFKGAPREHRGSRSEHEGAVQEQVRAYRDRPVLLSSLGEVQ